MALLERHTQLAELAAALRDAAAGQGSVAVVTGEAGVGKTSLVRAFADEADAAVWWGVCDDLLTPRPLGPFRDMFTHLNGQPDLGTFLDAITEELSGPPYPTVVVVEDAHWADQATLDTIRFLGRRIARMRVLLVITYRADEVPADHPVRLTLGAIPSTEIRRIRLQPLTKEAVATLAGSADATDLYELTGGNPFFVHEVLAAPAERVPSTVQDAVMARVSRLDASEIAAVEVASVLPGRAERSVLDSCGVAAGIDSALRAGILEETQDGTIAFMNELARRAVEDGLSSARRRAVNEQVLTVLAGRAAEPSRLAHHAAQAGNAAALAMHAPNAARRAELLESHQAAVEHYEQALGCADQFTPGERADLLDALARQCRLVGRNEQALAAVRQAIELAHDLGDDRRRGRCLVLQAEISLLAGLRTEAQQSASAAIGVLSDVSDSETLRAAYALQSRLAMITGNPAEALTWGKKAEESGGPGDAVTEANLAVTLATARWQLDPDDDKPLIECHERLRSAGLTYPAARACVNVSYGNVLLMRYLRAEEYIADGLAYTEENEHVLDYWYLLASRATLLVETGRWVEADVAISQLADTVPVIEQVGLWLQGLLQVRRGDPEAAQTLRTLRRLAEETAWPVGLLRAMSAQAELAFLTRRELPPADVTLMRDLLRTPRAWSRGADDAALWLARTGLLDQMPEGLSGPRALHVAGHWERAAEEWAEVGRPYDQADALADADAPKPLLEALEIFDRLGARARGALVRERLAKMGVSSVPRGPRRTTWASPAGLTPRQAEVLELLATGLTYQQIADRLHVSIKTVDHHVTAVRTKLDVSSRGEAVVAAHRLGLVGVEDGDGPRPT